MEGILVAFWLLAALVLPIGLVVSGYVGYCSGRNLGLILVSFIIAFIAYVPLSLIWLEINFVVVYAGAHTDPVGDALSRLGELFLLAFNLLYLAIGWLLCSFVAGQMLKPPTPFSFRRHRSISVVPKPR